MPPTGYLTCLPQVIPHASHRLSHMSPTGQPTCLPQVIPHASHRLSHIPLRLSHKASKAVHILRFPLQPMTSILHVRPPCRKAHQRQRNCEWNQPRGSSSFAAPLPSTTITLMSIAASVYSITVMLRCSHMLACKDCGACLPHVIPHEHMRFSNLSCRIVIIILFRFAIVFHILHTCSANSFQACLHEEDPRRVYGGESRRRRSCRLL